MAMNVGADGGRSGFGPTAAHVGKYALSQRVADRTGGLGTGALVKDKTRLSNRTQTQTVAFVNTQSKARLALVSQQLRDIDAEINARITAENPGRRALQIISSIPASVPSALLQS